MHSFIQHVAFSAVHLTIVSYLLLTSFIELSQERGFSEKYCPHQQINVT